MLYITAMLCNLTQPLNHYISDSTKNECKTFCSIYTFNFNLNLVHVWWLFCMYVSFIKNWYNANIYRWLTWTHYSHILRMGAGISSERKRFAALSQVHLCSCTPHIAVPGWTTAGSKGCRCVCSQVSQLMAHNCGINKIPSIVTHSAPLAKNEYLNTSISWISPSCQSHTAFFYCVIYCHICNGDSHKNVIAWMGVGKCVFIMHTFQPPAAKAKGHGLVVQKEQYLLNRKCGTVQPHHPTYLPIPDDHWQCTLPFPSPQHTCNHAYLHRIIA